MRRALLLLPLVAGCWTLDLPDLDVDRLPLEPAVGAPEDWWVEGFEMVLDCPDGEPARFWIAYPGWADRRLDALAPSVPMALVFHSGAFDYVFEPASIDPTDGASFQNERGQDTRLGAAWAARQIYTSLGLYPNRDADEEHAGTLAAALAEKGIASLWVTNCWGDVWHNRESSTSQNNFTTDLFFRNGRTAAEFAWRYAFEEFPPGNPLTLPVRADAERIFLVGLGDGARAVGELLAIQDTEAASPDLDTVYRYKPHAVVLDAPVDDYRPYFASEDDAFGAVRSGLARIFPGVSPSNAAPLEVGAVSARLPTNPGACGHGFNLPERLGVLYSCNDTRYPITANDRLLTRLGTSRPETCAEGAFTGSLVRDLDPERGSFDCVEVPTWVWRDAGISRPLSNADPSTAKAVADFLGEGLEGLDAAFVP